MTQILPSKIDNKLKSLYNRLDGLFDAADRGFRTGASWHEEVKSIQTQIRTLEGVRE